MRQDIYQRITDQIVSELEKGVRPWFQPWHVEHAAGRITRPLRCNGIPYRGINIVMLWGEAMQKGYAAPIWMTFKQALELKANVRKGERGSLVVYADKITRTETDAETGEESDRAIPFMKGYTVFNAEQIEGLPEHFYAKPAPRDESIHRIERAESFLAATGAELRHGGNRAYYNITDDFIQLPPFESFRDAESYYATRAHETTHWTRHASRLNREFGRKRWGDEGYAAEELVAELRLCLPVRRPRIDAGGPRRSRRLYRVVDQGPEERQARDLHRRLACAARRRFPARLAESQAGGGGMNRPSKRQPANQNRNPEPGATDPPRQIGRGTERKANRPNFPSFQTPQARTNPPPVPG